MSRTRLPFENPIVAAFQRSKGGDWNLLLVGHLPLRCKQSDDPGKCDELYAFRTVLFRFDDHPQIALEIVHAGEPHLMEAHVFRLDRGRLDTTFTATGPRPGLDVEIEPDGVARRIAVDTFINKELPPRYRSFTLTTSYVFGERKFRIASESLEPEWTEAGGLDLSYWGLVHQSTFASDLAKLQERQKKVAAEAPWALDPTGARQEAVPRRAGRTRHAAAAGSGDRELRARQLPGAHRRIPAAREWEGEKSLWDFALIRSPEEPAYECLGEAPGNGKP